MSDFLIAALPPPVPEPLPPVLEPHPASVTATPAAPAPTSRLRRVVAPVPSLVTPMLSFSRRRCLRTQGHTSVCLRGFTDGRPRPSSQPIVTLPGPGRPC